MKLIDVIEPILGQPRSNKGKWTKQNAAFNDKQRLFDRIVEEAKRLDTEQAAANHQPADNK
jgi:hypothetical protein